MEFESQDTSKHHDDPTHVAVSIAKDCDPSESIIRSEIEAGEI